MTTTVTESTVRQSPDQGQEALRLLTSDHRIRRSLLRRLQLSREGRTDLVQFDVLPDGERTETLAVRDELLVRQADLASSAIRRLIADHGLRAVPIACLEGRVVRLAGAGRSGPLEGLLHDIAARRLPVSVNHVTPMGGVVMKGGSVPTPVAAGPAFRGAAGGGVRPVVAVLDTGIGEQPRSDGWLAGLVTEDNVDPLDAIPRNGVLDPGAGHGTFAAGIVQQVAPSAEVRMHRVMDSAGIGSEVQVACAMLRAAAEGAAVLNLSLGTQSFDDSPPVALEAALELLAERHPDVLVVAAAGNGGDRRPCWPAAFPDVVAVAGLTAELTPADWSDRGEWVTCSTVGEGVVSTYVAGRHAATPVAPPAVFGTDSWASWTGTSFAAPQVAGAVAAHCAAVPGTTPRQALTTLLADGRPTREFGQALQLLPVA